VATYPVGGGSSNSSTAPSISNQQRNQHLPPSLYQVVSHYYLFVTHYTHLFASVAAACSQNDVLRTTKQYYARHVKDVIGPM